MLREAFKAVAVFPSQEIEDGEKSVLLRGERK